MKYVCLVYAPEDAMRTVNDAECQAYNTALSLTQQEPEKRLIERKLREMG